MPSVITIAVMIISFVLLALSLKQILLGVGYVIWTGIGIVGALIVGVIFLDEAVSFLRIFAAILILLGIVLMKVS